jgi:hypothetical protein
LYSKIGVTIKVQVKVHGKHELESEDSVSINVNQQKHRRDLFLIKDSNALSRDLCTRESARRRGESPLHLRDQNGFSVCISQSPALPSRLRGGGSRTMHRSFTAEPGLSACVRLIGEHCCCMIYRCLIWQKLPNLASCLKWQVLRTRDTG